MKKFTVVILDKAEDDIDREYLWYELEEIGLGETFYNTIRQGLVLLGKIP